jgi:hypothetical protein
MLAYCSFLSVQLPLTVCKFSTVISPFTKVVCLEEFEVHERSVKTKAVRISMRTVMFKITPNEQGVMQVGN